MSIPHHNALVWDRLFELLQPCDENVTDAEVDADLTHFGIDMATANQRLHKMIAEQRARLQFATAKARRTAIGERIQNVCAPKIDDLRDQLRNLIGGLSGQDQLAYFHKLEGTASEQDLQSLMDDLEKLATIRKLGDGPESK